MIISFDIDGVLNDYPHCWLRYVNMRANTAFPSKDAAIKKLGSNLYKQLKTEYRHSNYKENLPVNESMKILLNHLADEDHVIIISTSRPILSPEYKLLEKITTKWLKKNHIKFSKLVFKDEAGNFITNNNIEVHIDDEMKYAKVAVGKGAKAILFNKFSRENSTDSVIPEVSEESSIREYLL